MVVVVVAFAAFGAAFFAGAAFVTLGAGASADAVLARRGRPAAAVVSYSLPRDDVTVAGGSAAAAAAFPFAGVAFAFVLAFFGGIVVTVLYAGKLVERCRREEDGDGVNEQEDEGEVAF